MTKADVLAVYQLSSICFTMPWSKAAIEKEMDNPVATYFVAEQDQEIIGYSGLWLMADEAEVINIAVSPKYQGKGVGSQLLEALLSMAKSLNTIQVFLEVRVSNEAALALYKKHGFNELGRRKNYYHEPTEDAINMGCQL